MTQLRSRAEIGQEYKKSLKWENKGSSLELLIQEFESILSQDFSKMTLEELELAEKKFLALAGMRDFRETITPSDAQRESRDFLWFRLRQEKHKDESVKIGDIFYSHWGYDQTNTEMFKVVGFTKSKKSAIIRQIGLKTKAGSEGFMCDQVMPDPNNELKKQEYDEDQHRFIDLKEHKDDLKVKIIRGSDFNPRTHQHEQIGEIMLRGSVYYANDSKHLQNLYKMKADDSTYRSWYA